MNITITIGRDGFYGTSSEDEFNTQKSEDNYTVAVLDKVQTAFPQAEIEIVWIGTTLTPRMTDADDEYDVLETVANIEADVYNAGGFWVEK